MRNETRLTRGVCVEAPVPDGPTDEEVAKAAEIKKAWDLVGPWNFRRVLDFYAFLVNSGLSEAMRLAERRLFDSRRRAQPPSKS